VNEVKNLGTLGIRKKWVFKTSLWAMRNWGNKFLKESFSHWTFFFQTGIRFILFQLFSWRLNYL
jgi:hypothetical protein